MTNRPHFARIHPPPPSSPKQQNALLSQCVIQVTEQKKKAMVCTIPWGQQGCVRPIGSVLGRVLPRPADMAVFEAIGGIANLTVSEYGFVYGSKR